MKSGLPYLFLALALYFLSNYFSGNYTNDMNGFLLNLASSLGSLFGSFILAGFVIGYMSLPKRTFVGWKK